MERQEEDTEERETADAVDVPLTRFQISLHVGSTAFPDTIDNRASPSGGRQEFAAGDFQAQHCGRA